jgi:hypothetical protein
MSDTKLPAGLKTLKGSCHCGAVRYEVDYDASTGTGRCNCSICTKSAWWGINVKPGAFRLLSGEESLSDYSRSAAAHNRFCKVCGIRCFGHGDVPEIGGAYYSVNVHTLDGVDFDGVKVTYLDGRSDTWALLNEAPHANPFRPARQA